MNAPTPRGLPPRIYVPIAVVLAGAFLAVMFYLIAAGFGVSGSVLGSGAKPGSAAQTQQADTAKAVQGGGPPATVAIALKTLRDRIAAHPNDDVAMTQLADMYLTVGKFREAIPLYERALKVNPRNVAAQGGLEQAKTGLTQSQ